MRRSSLFWIIAPLALASMAPNCDRNEGAASNTSCTAGVALIGVRDGLQANFCGCLENSTEWVTAPSIFTCTVPAGTVVVFQYIDIKLRHQIMPVGTPELPTGPLIEPVTIRNNGPINYSNLFSNAGTYTYQDAYDESLKGQIIVQ